VPQPRYTQLNDVYKLSTLSCAVGESSCAFVLSAYTSGQRGPGVPVSFGGLKLSATLDGQLHYTCSVGKGKYDCYRGNILVTSVTAAPR